MRAASSQGANGSVTSVRFVRSATIKSMPKMGTLSTQLACALASRCKNGDRLELSGLNSFAAMEFVKTNRDRSASIRMRRNSVHAVNPMSTCTDTLFKLQSPSSFARESQTAQSAKTSCDRHAALLFQDQWT